MTTPALGQIEGAEEKLLVTGTRYPLPSIEDDDFVDATPTEEPVPDPAPVAEVP